VRMPRKSCIDRVIDLADRSSERMRDGVQSG
jgi:hypothetical protein